MSWVEFLIYQSFFIILGYLLINYVIKQEDYEHSIGAKQVSKLIIYGFIGWIVAYLRVIIIQIYQLLILIAEGVDIENQDEILNSPILLTYRFNIIGPLISGLFEETIRYWLLFVVLRNNKNKYDRKYAPLIFGFSWAYSEILILTLPFITLSNLSIFTLLISGYERLISLIFHIALTYLVIYGKSDNRKSLYYAIIAHTIVNLVALVMILEFSSSNFIIFAIEGTLSLLIIVFVWFVISYRKKMEISFLANIEKI